MALMLVACGEPPPEAAPRLAPVAGDELPKVAASVPAAAPASPQPRPTGRALAPEPAAAPTVGATQADAAAAGGELVQLTGATVASVNKAVALYTEFVAIVARHPEDCVALQKDLSELGTRHRATIVEVTQMKSKLSQNELKAAQQLMQSSLPPQFVGDLIGVGKRCAGTPGFAEAMAVLQGKV
jgi:hypothetical protein